MVKIYSTSWCSPCKMAKRILDERGTSYKEINIEEENISREKLKEITGGMTVPQIIINNNCIGGFDQLFALHQSGELDSLLQDD